MKKNPITKRGLYRQAESDPRVYDLSQLIFSTALSFSGIAAAGGINDKTVAGIAYCETRYPRHTTIAGILKGCGYREAWLDIKSEIEFAFRDDAEAMKSAAHKREVFAKEKAKRKHRPKGEKGNNLH